MLASNFVLFKFEYNVHESGYNNEHKIYVKINFSRQEGYEGSCCFISY